MVSFPSSTLIEKRTQNAINFIVSKYFCFLCSILDLKYIFLQNKYFIIVFIQYFKSNQISQGSSIYYVNKVSGGGDRLKGIWQYDNMFVILHIRFALVSKESVICPLPFDTKQTYNSFRNLAWSQIRGHRGLNQYVSLQVNVQRNNDFVSRD
jgi:hypothetical protein